MIERFWQNDRRPLNWSHAGTLVRASPRPYRGFTYGRADFIDQFHDVTNWLVMPGVEHVAWQVKVGSALMLH